MAKSKKRKKQNRKIVKDEEVSVAESAFAVSDAKNNKIAYLLSVSIALLAFVLYFNTTNNGFSYDDEVVVEKNDFITSWSNFHKLFTRDYLSDGNKILSDRKDFTGAAEVTYRPVVTFSYMLDHSIWEKDPFGYHLTNVIIHALCSVLLFFFVWKLFSNLLWASLSGLIFAAHPVATEAVNAISFREDPLSLMFILLSLYFFLKAWRENIGQFKYAIISSVFALLACLSKETGVLIPLLMGGIIMLKPKKDLSDSKLAAVFLIPCAAVAFYLFVYFILMSNPTEDPIGLFGDKLSIHIAAWLRVYGIYIQLFLFPHNLCVDHDFQPLAGLFDLYSLYSLIAMALVFVLGYIAYKRKWLGGFGLFWIAVTLLLVSGIIPLRHPAAERFLYVPLAGYSIFLSWLIWELSKFLSKRLNVSAVVSSIVIVIPLILLGGCKIVDQNKIWKDTETLWTATVEVNPRSYRGFFTSGNFARRRGDYHKAIELYKNAVKASPYEPDAYNNLGICYVKLKEFEKAIEVYDDNIEKNPRNHKVYSNKAQALFDLKRYEEALESNDKALLIFPNYVHANYNKSRILYVLNKPEEGMKYLRKALKINPNFKPAVKFYNFLMNQSQ